MERKLATILFIDLVESTALVSASDPEVVRRRIGDYFQRAAQAIEAHGGMVEKFVGDAVMAAFGVPRAHEDDAERAVRAAFAIFESLQELGLEARAGIESGEVVIGEGDATFVTGEAVNIAARLQQLGPPGAIMLGPAARRLTEGTVEVADSGAIGVSGLLQVPSWQAIGVLGKRLQPTRSPFVGRRYELELLANLYQRSLCDRRAYLVSVIGEPGVGKSRLVEEFVNGLGRATILKGQALSYGEGVGYWPIASMIKSAAGISDDEPAAQAFDKLLRSASGDDAVAELLAVTLGQSGQRPRPDAGREITWAISRWVELVARGRPTVLIFDDMHWADEALLDLIEHLVGSMRQVPILLVCIARLELLEKHPNWLGGDPTAARIDIAPLSSAESGQLAGALSAGRAANLGLLVGRAGGNPLFIEELARMLTEADADELRADERIPDTVQALIGARIDLLKHEQKRLLQQAAVVGRVFWRGALARLTPEVEIAQMLDELVERALIEVEEVSTISGEGAFRFKHALVCDVAYSSMTKADRARSHRVVADWMGFRAPDELLEIRAHHLDRACVLLAELEAELPRSLLAEAAAVLERAGERTLLRDSFAGARRMYQRANELAPTLERRYMAAHTSLELGDLGTAAIESEAVRVDARTVGERRIEGRALCDLAAVALARNGDPSTAAQLAQQALGLLPEEDVDARADAYRKLATSAWWLGESRRAESYFHEMLALAEHAARPDLWELARRGLVWLLELRLELDAAEQLLMSPEATGDGALEGARSKLAVGSLRRLQGRLGEAKVALAEARSLYSDAGVSGEAAQCRLLLGWIALVEGDLGGAEGEFREAVRVLEASQDHGRLCEAERGLAETLLECGQIEEAERYALAGRLRVTNDDRTSFSATLKTLGLVRAAQGQDDEAEALLRESLTAADGTDFRLLQVEVVAALVDFLRLRERVREAEELEKRLPERIPGWLSAADRMVARPNLDSSVPARGVRPG